MKLLKTDTYGTGYEHNHPHIAGLTKTDHRVNPYGFFHGYTSYVFIYEIPQ